MNDCLLNPATTSAAIILARGDNGRIGAQTAHDTFAGYRFGARFSSSGNDWRAAGARMLRNTEVQWGVRNVFNTEPAFSAQTISRLYSPFADPRVSSYYISVKKAF